MKRGLKVFLIGALASACLIGCGGNDEVEYDPIKEGSTVEWSSGGLWDLLPQPDSLNGELTNDSSEYVSFYLYGPIDECEAYIDKCVEAGFTEDYQRDEGFYDAYDAEGHYLNIYFFDGEDRYSVGIRQEALDQSCTTEENTESTDVDPDFKAAMDSYEAFFNEYCDFIETYNNSSDVTSLAADYADYMAQYTETMGELSKIDESTLSQADALYYAEVGGRISQRLAEVGMSLQ